MNGGRVTQQDLVAACQSDKVAASRAMTQNQSLKKQLEELEMAVIETVSVHCRVSPIYGAVEA